MNGRKYLQIIYLIRDEYISKIYIKNSYNLIARKNNVIKNCAEESKGHFSNEDIQMASRYVKRYSISLIREMQIKTTVRYHLIPVRMAIIRKTRDNKY